MSRRSRESVKRTRYDIYAELLRVISIYGDCPLTRAARSTNMPVDRAKTAIDHLVSRGLLDEEVDGRHRVYRVSVRGYQYLELYQRIAALVGAPITEPTIGM